MIEGLLDIFADTRDQARAITAIFISVMALSAVFINQWFSSRRARKEKLIDKTEEIYETTINSIELIKKYDNLFKHARHTNEEVLTLIAAKHELNESIDRILMLASLYFTALVKIVDSIKTKAISLSVSSKAKATDGASDIDYIYDELQKLLEQIVNHMKSNMH